jgi:aminopeptidase YwaD
MGYRKFFSLRSILLSAAFAFTASALFAQTSKANSVPSSEQASTAAPASVCPSCIRGNMEFLASDALQGRGSGTHDELLAATFIAAQLRAYGIEPAGTGGGYLQPATILHQTLTRMPRLSFQMSGKQGLSTISWICGQQFLAVYLGQTDFSGPLQKIDIDAGKTDVKPGAVVFLTGKNADKAREAASGFLSQGAVAVLSPPSKTRLARWAELGKELPEVTPQVEGAEAASRSARHNLIAVNGAARALLAKLPDGTKIHFHGAAGSVKKNQTWNVIGTIRGSDDNLRDSAVMFSAHLDHLGIGAPVKGDTIYNGADDDASGVIAVLELARVLGQGPPPRRSVYFTLFGSEEQGGLGSTYFREHPPLPFKYFAAMLEFEMIGRSDPAVARDELWLTGWERSNLGPELAAHGAALVADPHPQEDFFQRSDNYVFAKKGLVAQTISSYGMHKDYHQPSDDIAHLDFEHIDEAIASLIKPIQWLVNSDFKPEWKPGQNPQTATE